MNWFGILRIVAWVKRIAIACERLADALETLADLSQKEWTSRNIRNIPGKPTEIESFDYEGANKQWKEYLRSKGLEVDEYGEHSR